MNHTHPVGVWFIFSGSIAKRIANIIATGVMYRTNMGISLNFAGFTQLWWAIQGDFTNIFTGDFACPDKKVANNLKMAESSEKRNFWPVSDQASRKNEPHPVQTCDLNSEIIDV